MFLFFRVPLAWLNLTHDRRRLIIRVLGVAFAVFLMFAELGFYNAVLDAAGRLIEQFNGQIFIVSKAQYALAIKAQPFTTRRLAQAREVPGVHAAYAVYLEYTLSSFWKDNGAGPSHLPHSLPVRVIAFDLDQPVLNIPEVQAQRNLLKVPYHVLLDEKSKEHYGEDKPQIKRELAQHFIYSAGTFRLGTDFASDGNIILSDWTYAQLFPNELAPADTLHLADVGVVCIDEQSVDVETVCQALRAVLAPDVDVYTKKQLIERERDYWLKTTPIGYIFWIGMIMGFIVGVVICYQIISTDVAENLSEYATLKAIGYADRYLNGVVLREALWLAFLGFMPGLGLSWLLYRLVDFLVGLPMILQYKSTLFVLLVTLLMCVISGLIALRKVQTADPAEVFA